MHLKRISPGALGTAAILVLAGCQPYTPGPSMLSPQPLVAPAPAPPPAPPGPPAPAQGRYIGRTAVAYGGVDQACLPLTLTNFTVHGATLRFGHFIGRIKPDGSVYMQAGQDYIEGHFIGSHFDGYYWSPPPNCTFTLSFDPER